MNEVTFDLVEAAKFLHMSPAVLRQKARRGLVKGAKPGKCWVFLKSDLVLYLRSLYPTHEQAPCSDWLTQQEANRLLNALPEYLAEMVRFTLATGLRESNVTDLQWSQVDLKRQCAWIHPDQAKARKAIPVPLNSDASAVLERQRGKHDVFVFSYQGKKVRNGNNHTWRKVLKQLGIDNFRWHDLRHTWASWYIQRGTPLHVLQELGGWAGPEMVQRYAHLSADHLKAYADRLVEPLGN